MVVNSVAAIGLYRGTFLGEPCHLSFLNQYRFAIRTAHRTGAGWRPQRNRPAVGPAPSLVERGGVPESGRSAEPATRFIRPGTADMPFCRTEYQGFPGQYGGGVRRLAASGPRSQHSEFDSRTYAYSET